MMKSKFSFVFLIIIIFSLCSCFDITQSISMNEDRYNIGFRCGFDKNLMYLANEDEESLSGDQDHFEEQIDQIGGTFKRIDTTDEVGIYFNFDCSTDAELTSDLIDFLPEFRKGKTYIPFLLGEQIKNLEIDDNDMAITMLSICKYRLLVNKNFKQTLQTAQLTDKTGKHTIDLQIDDFGDVYCVSVPVKTVFLSRYTFEYITLK